MRDPIKLKSKDIKPLRERLLQEQDGLCAVCELPCSQDKAVTDHCHRFGHCRGTIHRSCNSLLGKIENGAPRYGMSREQLLAFLSGAGAYLEKHKNNISGFIHPTFFTSEEKLARRKAKAKKQRAKLKSDKATKT